MQSPFRRIHLAIAVALISTVLASHAPASGQDTPTCNGLTATIVGTEGRDNLRGTPGADVIVGLGGPDRIVGLGGDDTICGGEGRDLIRGGNGRDTIFGDGGRDRIHGGGGEDSLHGNGGNDRVYGGNRDDFARGNRGDDLIDGGEGRDDCFDRDGRLRHCEVEESDDVIRVARATWNSGYVQAEIIAELLLEMGYSVDPPQAWELPPDLGYQTLASGDIDVFANGWFPIHDQWLDQSTNDGTPLRPRITVAQPDGAVADGGVQGFLVTKAWADEEGFTTIEEINDNLNLWAELDRDGNGKGEIYGCPNDWTCDDIINSLIAFNNWDHLEQEIAGYDDMFADFLTAAQAGDPAVMYTWTPTLPAAMAAPGETTMWLSMADSSVLDDSNPLGTEGGENHSQRRNGVVGFGDMSPGTCLLGPDGCQLGWNAAALTPTYNTAWGSKHPEAVRLLEIVGFDAMELTLLSAELRATDMTREDTRRIARQWLDSHRPAVEAWISEALNR